MFLRQWVYSGLLLLLNKILIINSFLGKNYFIYIFKSIDTQLYTVFSYSFSSSLISSGSSVSLSVVSDSLWLHGLSPTSLLCRWSSPGKNTAVGSHSHLHGIFLIQGSNLHFLHCRQILYHLRLQGSPLKDGDANNYFFQKKKRDRIFERGLGTTECYMNMWGLCYQKYCLAPSWEEKEEGEKKGGRSYHNNSRK